MTPLKPPIANTMSSITCKSINIQVTSSPQWRHTGRYRPLQHLRFVWRHIILISIFWTLTPRKSYPSHVNCCRWFTIHQAAFKDSGHRIRFLTCVRRLTHVIAIGWTSVRLSVRLSRAGIVSKRLNLSSNYLCQCQRPWCYCKRVSFSFLTYCKNYCNCIPTC